MIRELVDLMMPRECLVCGRRLGAQEKHLCIWCAADLPCTWYWERKHNPMADRFNALLERTRADGASLDYAYAAALLFYHHENPYKRIPQALKYGHNLSAGRYFAARLGIVMGQADHFADVDTVIPVPLHWWRKWRRGYNQAEVIAAALARALHARLRAHALVRVRRTRSQTRLRAEARLKNTEGVFRLRHPFPARHVLIVDDTFTTGATLYACYNAVRKALGPSVRISVATLAVVEA
jgi:ComF family protein